MSQDDMHVVMYKILAYLYSCMKNGEQPVYKHYCHNGDVLNIPEQYWCQIIKQLVDHGYVDGFVVVTAWGGDLIVKANNPTITIEGVDFLQNNSTMQKALNVLKEAKSALPFI